MKTLRTLVTLSILLGMNSAFAKAVDSTKDPSTCPLQSSYERGVNLRSDKQLAEGLSHPERVQQPQQQKKTPTTHTVRTG